MSQESRGKSFGSENIDSVETRPVTIMPEHYYRNNILGISDVVHYGLAAFMLDTTSGHWRLDKVEQEFVKHEQGPRSSMETRLPVFLQAIRVYGDQYPDDEVAHVYKRQYSYDVVMGLGDAVRRLLSDEPPKPADWRGL